MAKILSKLRHFLINNKCSQMHNNTKEIFYSLTQKLKEMENSKNKTKNTGGMRKKMRHVPNGKSWTEEAERAENAEDFPASIKGANAQIEEEKRVLINKHTNKQQNHTRAPLQ